MALAWDDPNHPCHDVVNCQRSAGLSGIQRPEPWVGGLTTARVLFIASNPSISDEPGDIRENYPTASWSDEDAGDFFVQRFDPDRDPVLVTFGHSTEPNFLALSIDGEYRSGTLKPKSPQPTWNAMHRRAVELLGADAHPHRDWALTEVVHCKSKREKGVQWAAPHCSATWLSQIVAMSPAPIIFAMGSGGNHYFAKTLPGCPPGLGSGVGYANMTQSERRERDIFVAEVGGSRRVIVYLFRNGSSYVQKLPVVFGEASVLVLRAIANGDRPVPATTAELHGSLSAD